MLDPRIYRTGLIAVIVAVILVAFSLSDQDAAVGTTLPSEAFNGQNAYHEMLALARRFPSRAPGSAADDRLARIVASTMHSDGLSVTTSSATAATAVGTRRLTIVSGSLTGLSSGSIVVVAHRDSLAAPATADLSGTAVLLELARVLAGETQHRSMILVSTSGSAGAAGAAEVARRLPRPVDAVIVLGDLAGARVRQPVIVPWSNGLPLAPARLRNTVAVALRSQAGMRTDETGLVGQFAHLAFPLSVTEQAPFGVRGIPAVLVSLRGPRPASAREALDPAAPGRLGRAVLATVNALDTAPAMPAPSAYLLWGGKVVPAWAIRILVLALTLPVAVATVDGVARARRRGYRAGRRLVWVLAAAAPFAAAWLLAKGAGLIGVLGPIPGGPVGVGEVPLGVGGVVVLVLIAVVVAAGYRAWRPLVDAITGGHAPRGRADPGAGAALLLVLCAITLLVWTRNPFAAALLVPALHAWMWIADPRIRLPRTATFGLLLAGVVPVALIVVYYACLVGAGPIEVAWNALLLTSGGYIGAITALAWCVVLGCLVSIVSISLRRPRFVRQAADQAPVTIRGPITYAGPGSLGGTESRLRR